jgi:hypothetical protein
MVLHIRGHANAIPLSDCSQFVEAAMTNYLPLQAFQIVSLDALEQQREKLAMLGDQFQADHQVLIHQSILGWLDYSDWFAADLAAFQKLTTDVQQLAQLEETFLDLEQWLTSGFVPGVNPLGELSDRPVANSGVRTRETGRSPQIQTSLPLQTDSISTSAAEPTRFPGSPDSVLPMKSGELGESITLRSQSPIRSTQTDPGSTASAAEPTRFSTPTAFSRIGEHFTSAQSGSDSDLFNSGRSGSDRSDLQAAKDFPSSQGEWENQPVEDPAVVNETRFEPASSVHPDLTWRSILPHSSLSSTQSQAEVPLTLEETTSEETETQINQSFQGLRDFAQMLETESGWRAIAPDSLPAIDWQESELANQTILSDQRSDDPEVRPLSRGRRMNDKRMTSSVSRPEITVSHNLDAAQSLQQPLQQPSEIFDPIRENTLSSQMALPLSQSHPPVRDLQPEKNESEVRPLRLSEPDLDMILEAIAQEVQREYRQFYGS